jgi:ATP-binding cassette subfamily C exporter for protease/lipase
MYGDPSLIVLDEPNSNLDDVGEQALVRAVADLRQQGKTIVLITHRTSAIGATTKLLLLRDGQAEMFGPTEQVLQALQQQNQQAQQQMLAQQQAAQQQAAQQQAAQQQAAMQQQQQLAMQQQAQAQAQAQVQQAQEQQAVQAAAVAAAEQPAAPAAQGGKATTEQE